MAKGSNWEYQPYGNRKGGFRNRSWFAGDAKGKRGSDPPVVMPKGAEPGGPKVSLAASILAPKSTLAPLDLPAPQPAADLSPAPRPPAAPAPPKPAEASKPMPAGSSGPPKPAALSKPKAFVSSDAPAETSQPKASAPAAAPAETSN